MFDLTGKSALWGQVAGLAGYARALHGQGASGAAWDACGKAGSLKAELGEGDMFLPSIFLTARLGMVEKAAEMAGSLDIMVKWHYPR